jgi:dTDP-4-amino-4,6-dideoxygalactose transaminase
MIPLADSAAVHSELATELEEAALRVLRSGRYILGPEVAAFEEELADWVGVKNAVGVASGTDALLLSLAALNLPKGSKIVTTPFTFFSTVSCIVRLGYEPIFADIDPVSLNLDIAKTAEACQDEAVRAVIGVDIYGDPLDYAALRNAIGRSEVKLIEDAAQSFGAELNGKRAGALADAAIFSFFPAKNLGAAGDGGAVVTDDDELAERVRVLRVHGSKPKYFHHLVGYNSRLDPLQAAMLRVKLRHMEVALQQRTELAQRYAAGLSGVVEVPQPIEGHQHAWNYYTVMTERRDELAAYLKEQNVASAIYYPRPLHLQPCFAYLGYGEGSFPRAEAACERVLALPMYPQLTRENQNTVIAAIRSFHGK